VWIFPSRDIHLVRNATPNTVSLRAFIHQGRSGPWTDASTNTHDIAFHPFPVAGRTAPTMPTLNGTAGGPASAVTVTPNDVGEWVVHIEWTHHDLSDPANPSHDVQNGAMRVSVHQDITGLFAGDRLISMWAGESDRQITVFAQFTGGVFDDITAHPYLKYRVEPPTLATVDPAEGRITALTAGIGDVVVSTWDDRFEFRVGLAVAPPLNAGGVPATTEQLRKRTPKHRQRLFVLAEGYQDRAKFFEHAHKSVDEWLRNEPYKRIADQFDAVAVFLSAPQTYITIASPVAFSNQVTDPTRTIWEGATFTAANTAIPRERMLTRDTIFGLMAGSRLSTPLVQTSRQVPTAPFRDLFVPHSARTIQPDPRRLGRFADNPRDGYISFITRYLAGAGHVYGPNDRIVMLVNDRIHLGTSFFVLGLPLDAAQPSPRPMTALGIRSNADFRVVGVAANTPLLDRDPDPSHDAGGKPFEANKTGSVIAHELGHTYGLGDEYENRREEHYNSSGTFETNENLHSDRSLRIDQARTLRDLATNVDVTKIKWNVHRIKKVSPSTRVVHNPGPSTLTLTVAPDQVRRWTPGERVFVRNRITTRIGPRRFTSIAAQIIRTDPTNNTIDVSVPLGTAPAPLGQTPLLYLAQRRKDGTELSVIDPVVLAFIAANGPFIKPTQCLAASETDNHDVPCPEIPGFKRPSVHAQGIGLYEGGADISCGIYRPTGRCKMRNQDSEEYVITDQNVQVWDVRTQRMRPKGHWATVIIDFCWVCQYMLIDLLDPSQHEWLDKQYWKDC
jgi:hypothetical protein